MQSNDPVRNVADLVRRTAAVRGSQRALIFRDTTLTWAEVDLRVDAAAAALRGIGLAEGDRVALALPNGLDAPIVYFAALRAGLVAVPTNPEYTAREFTHVLGDSGTVAVVANQLAAEAIGTVRDRLPRLAHVLRTDAFERLAAAAPYGPVHTDRGGEDLAVLMYTSGTSGLPRGAMLSHRAMLANLDQCARIEPPVVSPDDVILLALPLFHIYGLGPGLGQVAREGCAAVLVDRFDPAETLELIARHKVTNVPGAPPMFVAWSLLPRFGEVFGNVRLSISGAAPLPPDAQARMVQATGHPIYEGYGLTETAPVVTSTLVSAVPKPSSIGRPVPGVEVRLVDPATGEDLEELAEDLRELLDEVDAPTRDPGEVVVRGANLFSGYWPDGEGGPDADGWWHTGDVAVADEDGDLFLVDRIKELILVSGFNVYPREVEDVLLTHPGIVEAAVIGVPHPYTGETVKAYVVPAREVEVTPEEVVAHAERSLARFKCPTVVDVVIALPHSATGKVSKGRLRAREAKAAGA